MRYLTIIAVIFSFAKADAQTMTPSDSDLVCAVMLSAELAAHKSGTEEKQNVWMVFSFYLGRLTSRDDKANWGLAIRDRFPELRDRSGPSEPFVACVDFYKEKLASLSAAAKR